MDVEVLFKAIPIHFRQWTHNEIYHWLNLIALPQYADTFRTTFET